MYSRESYTRLNQTAVANELKQLLHKNEGSKAKIKEQTLTIFNKNQSLISIKVFQPSPKTKSKISETRK